MYKKMLVTLDGSELSECVLPHVEAFREGFPDCEVIMLQVVEAGSDVVNVQADAISPEQWKKRENEMKTTAEDYLNQVTARLAQRGSQVRAAVITGRVEDRIVEYVERESIDVIFMATHGRSGVSRWVRGSVADKVLRAAHVPVLMVRAPGTKGGGWHGI